MWRIICELILNHFHYSNRFDILADILAVKSLRHDAKETPPPIIFLYIFGLKNVNDTF